LPKLYFESDKAWRYSMVSRRQKSGGKYSQPVRCHAARGEVHPVLQEDYCRCDRHSLRSSCPDLLLDQVCEGGESGTVVVQSCVTLKRMYGCDVNNISTNLKSYGDGGVATREDSTSWHHAVTSLHVGGAESILTSFFMLQG